jgi:hypothetical protein
MVQKIIGDKLVTDRQQTNIFELIPIHKRKNIIIIFFCIWEGENKWGKIYTSVLATQVYFAHLLRSQGDKTDKSHQYSTEIELLSFPNPPIFSKNFREGMKRGIERE